MSLIPVLICIDVEPEQRAIDPQRRIDWRGVTETLDFFEQQARPLLASATGAAAHFSWFLRMDPQITQTYGTPAWVVTRYGARLGALEAAGDELGLHQHLWRWDEAGQHWLTDFANNEWAEQCTREGLRAYQESLGQPCRSIRFGDRWLNNSIFDLLEEAGVQYDLSAEPGLQPEALPEAFTGSMPDYTDVPAQPYRPARQNFLKPDGEARPLWMIPVSTGEIEWATEAFAAKSPATPDHRCSALEWQDGNQAAWSSLRGGLDHADCQWVAGWVCATDRPDQPMAVDIFDGTTRLGSMQTSQFRPDLLAAGLGSGYHGFRYPVPQRLRDGRQHTIRVKVAAADFELPGGPKEFSCASDHQHAAARLTLNLGLDAQLICALFDALLLKEAVAHLGLVVRSDVAVAPAYRRNLEKNLAHIAAHPRAAELRIVTPAAAITMIKEGSEL